MRSSTFETALQKDPDYAPAHTGVAFVWTVRNQMGFVAPGVATPQVKAAAMKAIELDPALAFAHYALGMAAWNEWDWETNEREFRRAIELDPNNADVRAFYSHLLIALKRSDEALAQIERARTTRSAECVYSSAIWRGPIFRPTIRGGYRPVAERAENIAGLGECSLCPLECFQREGRT